MRAQKKVRMMQNKSTVDEIRERFDHDVERFANLQTGQSSTVDAALVLELIGQAAGAVVPHATALLDVGCGAGNNALRILQEVGDGVDVTLIDLSRPMLDRAQSRVSEATNGSVSTIQSDVRELDLGENRFDVIVAAAVLHHLREEHEWEETFAKFYRALRPGGCIWISDLVQHSTEAIQQLMWHRYGEYLTELKDEAYRDHVFAYVEKEDSPRPLLFQIDMLRKVGFGQVDILHKNSNFAAFGGIK